MKTEPPAPASTDTLQDFSSYAKDCHDLEEGRWTSLRDESRQLANLIFILIGLESTAVLGIIAARSVLSRQALFSAFAAFCVVIATQIALAIRVLRRAYVDGPPDRPEMPNVIAAILSGKDRGDILFEIGNQYIEATNKTREDSIRVRADLRLSAFLLCLTLALLFVVLVCVVGLGLDPSRLL